MRIEFLCSIRGFESKTVFCKIGDSVKFLRFFHLDVVDLTTTILTTIPYKNSDPSKQGLLLSYYKIHFGYFCGPIIKFKVLCFK